MEESGNQLFFVWSGEGTLKNKKIDVTIDITSKPCYPTLAR